VEIERDQLAARVAVGQQVIGVHRQVIDVPARDERGLEVVPDRHGAQCDRCDPRRKNGSRTGRGSPAASGLPRGGGPGRGLVGDVHEPVRPIEKPDSAGGVAGDDGGLRCGDRRESPCWHDA